MLCPYCNKPLEVDRHAGQEYCRNKDCGHVIEFTKHWWSQEYCFSCHYDLIRDPDKLLKEHWSKATGCPRCYTSFVE